ncbi:MAG: hypothetical protein E6Q62_03255 [Nitrosomonas sp.]|nr:MAG: hypothetical protein E6Q62_03255 [Nitrosomonas sp.]
MNTRIFRDFRKKELPEGVADPNWYLGTLPICYSMEPVFMMRWRGLPIISRSGFAKTDFSGSIVEATARRKIIAGPTGEGQLSGTSGPYTVRCQYDFRRFCNDLVSTDEGDDEVLGEGEWQCFQLYRK